MRATFLSSLLIPAIFFCISEANASWGIGEVEITDIEGLPCYSVTSKNKNVRHIYLYAIDVGLVREVNSNYSSAWGIQRTEPDVNIPINNGHCILYGHMPDGAKSLRNINVKPDPFKIGKPYEVSIEAITIGSEMLEHLFVGRFCMQKNAGGGMVAKKITWDKQKQRYLNETCDGIPSFPQMLQK